MKKKLLELNSEEFVRLLLGVEKVCYFTNGLVSDAGTYTELYKRFRHKGDADSLKKLEDEYFDYNMILTSLDILDYLSYRTREFELERVKLFIGDLEFYYKVITESENYTSKREWRFFQDDEGGMYLPPADYNYRYAVLILKGHLWSAGKVEGKSRQESTSNKKGRPPKPFTAYLIGEHADAQLSALHEGIKGGKGKRAALMIKAAIKLGWIVKPTFAAVQNEFGDIGNRSGYNKCVNDVSPSDEVENAKTILLNAYKRVK